MKISDKKVDAFNAMLPEQIGDWIVDGMSVWALSGSIKGFFPHTFVGLFERPIEAVEALYFAPNCSLKTRRAIRRGVGQLGALCKKGSPEGVNFGDAERHSLLLAFLNIAECILCFEAAEILASIACDGAEFADAAMAEEAAELAIGTLGRIAIDHERSSFWTAEAKQLVEASLQRVAHSNYFKTSMAPFLLAALVFAHPEKVVEHLTLCGSEITEWHNQRPDQKQLAYLTAINVVEKAPLSLFRNFSSLSFRFASSRDRWLLEALFGPEGPLELVRDRDATRPMVTPKHKKTQVYRLQHDDWIGFYPARTNTDGAASSDDKGLGGVRNLIDSFFHDQAGKPQDAVAH